MDKNWKLQRYSRKDYSEVVEFPVEIVGRDGVVRRYSFEDSIRLYQRRVTFAPIRYTDEDLVSAEVHHCESRIDQLRRSFFHRFGWGTPDEGLDPLECFGPLAGELAAFLRRVLRCEGRPEIQLLPVSEDAGAESAWYVRPKTATSGMLLYFYHFEGPGLDALRERFFESLKVLERMPNPEADCERLVAFHHTADCGMVLTARAGEFEELESVPPADSDVDQTPTPWDAVMALLRRAAYPDVVSRCQELVSEQPYHRRAYLVGAALALGLDRAPESEDFAHIGARYFSDDALLWFYLGQARAAQGRHAEASVALFKAIGCDPRLAIARVGVVIAQLAGGASRQAAGVLADRGPRTRDRRSEDALDRLTQWTRWRRLMGLGVQTSLGLGLIATLLGGSLGLVPVAMGLTMAGIGDWEFRRQLVIFARRYGREELAASLRRVERAANTPPSAVS